MKGSLVVAALVFCLIQQNSIQSQEMTQRHGDVSSAGGWITLFDGDKAQGLRSYKGAGFPDNGWEVKDGNLHVLPGGGADLITEQLFGDFDLRFEFKTGPKGNSGVMYRVTESHDTPWKSGLEFQILDDSGHGLKGDNVHASGAIYDLVAAGPEKSLNPIAEFNTGRILLIGDRVRHWINGKKVLDHVISGAQWNNLIGASKFKDYAHFGLARRGHIAFQKHGEEVWFRNIRVRDLEARPAGTIDLFNGRDLAGWTHFLADATPASDVWSVRDGVLICRGNPSGYLRTQADFQNFILKFEWRFDPVTKKAGNSGALIRMIGPDKIWPRSVEAQLQSGNAGDFWNIDEFKMKASPDRTKGRNTRKTHFAENPVGEWNGYEIVVDGPHVGLWVNGELVNEATEVEEIAGKICLQSEGAEIHFRNIWLTPIR